MSTTISDYLPAPDAASVGHCERVTAHLVACIEAAGGSLTFADYMQAALYAPGLGYYSAGAAKFAEAGDFTTAPEVSPLFSAVLAGQCAEVLETLDAGSIVEFGAGSGVMAAGLLEALAGRERLPSAYYIVEVSADLRDRQRALMMERVPHLLSLVQWIDDPAALRVRGVILANEVLDALPVERFRIADNTVQQQVVCVDSGKLVARWQPAPPTLEAAVDTLQGKLNRRLPNQFESELCVMQPGWLQMVSSMLERGVVLLSDYGYGRNDYYSPERSGGTLTCHFRHHAHHDPLMLPGIQDITAWVDFSGAADALQAAGLDYLGFVPQAQFLLSGGLMSLLAAQPESLSLSRGVKTLTLPGEMGERFQFMGFRRDCDVIPSGFSGRDHGWRL